MHIILFCYLKKEGEIFESQSKRETDEDIGERERLANIERIQKYRRGLNGVSSSIGKYSKLRER